MIEFVTLLVGLVTGVHAVEVSVTEPVAAVELRLDGQQVTRRDEPPWTFELDLGPLLLPHVLEVVGFDAEGGEVGRDRQLVNQGYQELVVGLGLEPGEGGPASVARVDWPETERLKMLEFEARLDGEQVAVDRDGRIELGPYDPSRRHLLSAEARFQLDFQATERGLFGGPLGDTLLTEVTAVPVRLEGEAELPPAAEMKGWIEVNGEPVEVLSTVTEGAAIAVVRDTLFIPTAELLVRKKREKFYARAGEILDRDDRVIFQMTQEMERDPQGFFRTFPLLPEYNEGGMWYAVTQYAPALDRPVPQHLWLALALAGKRISAVERPRAVVVLLGKRPKDTGGLRFQQAQAYVSALGAPLFVWAPEEKTWDRFSIQAGEGFFTGPEGLAELFTTLGAEIDAQRTLWIAGDHAPSEIALGETARGIRLMN